MHGAPQRANMPSVTFLPLDAIDGFVAEGDTIGVEAALRTGRRPLLVNALDWPQPAQLATGTGPEVVGITDEVLPIRPGIALLRPPSLIVGMDVDIDVHPAAVEDAVVRVLASLELARSSIACVATLDLRAGNSNLHHLGLPVVGFPAARLHGYSATLAESAARRAAGPTARSMGTVVDVERRITTSVVRRTQPTTDYRAIATQRPTAAILLTGR